MGKERAYKLQSKSMHSTQKYILNRVVGRVIAEGKLKQWVFIRRLMNVRKRLKNLNTIMVLTSESLQHGHVISCDI